MNILRIVKIKRNRKAPVVILLLFLSFLSLVVWGMVLDIKENNQFEEYLESEDYESALSYLETQTESWSTTKKYAKYFFAQEKYDEAVRCLLDYCTGQDISEISDEQMDFINEYALKASDDVKSRVEKMKEDYEKNNLGKEKVETANNNLEENTENISPKKEDTSINSIQQENSGNETIKKTGRIATEDFLAKSYLVPAEEIYSLFDEYENIELISQNDKKLDETEKNAVGGFENFVDIEAKMSHFSKDDLVSIEHTVIISYLVNDDYRQYFSAYLKDVKLDLSNLEGKTSNIKFDFDTIKYLFGINIPDNYYNGYCEGTLTFHDLDQVCVEYVDDAYKVYSKKPVVKIVVQFDNQIYEGDFCLGVNDETEDEDGVFFTSDIISTDYVCIDRNNTWNLFLELISDKSNELVSVVVDVDNCY